MRKIGKGRDRIKLATRADIIACVALACLLIPLFALAVRQELVPPLYGGMLTVFAYLLLMTVWAATRRSRTPLDTADTVDALTGTTLGRTLTAIDAPAFLFDGQGYLLWANSAFLAALPAGMAGVGSHVSALLSDAALAAPRTETEGQPKQKALPTLTLGERIFSYEVMETPLGGKKAYLAFLYDKTAESSWRQTYTDERAAVLYISIDNIDETLESVQEQFHAKVLDVERVLHTWIDGMDGILRSYERNRYMAFLPTACLRKCCDMRFDILDKVRSVRVGDGLPITISIGISDVQGTLGERDRAAQVALDMALLRGGDQVAYKHDGGVDFYGGKTKTGFKLANIRARVVANQLAALMVRADHVLIMGHRFGDFDSFGAAVGIARFAMHCGVNAHIIANLQDPNLAPCFDRIAELPDYRGMFIDGAEGLDMLGKNVLLVVVDVNNFSHVECSDVAKRASRIVVIDHHRKTAEFGDNVVLEYIEPSASSASELITEMIQQHLPAGALEEIEAELLMSGMLLDTKQFTRNTGPRTFAAASFLRREGANPGNTVEFFKGGLEDLLKEARFNANVVLYRDRIAISTCEGETDGSYRVIAAKVADKLLNLRGIDAAFTLVMIDGNIHISARSNGTINVQLVLEHFHGSGHYDVAGAQVSGMTVQETVTGLRTAIDEQLS